MKTRFIVALGPEARPLIEHYRLAPEGDRAAARTYGSDEVELAVCGVGKSAAAACAASFAGEPPAPLINVGIAGHRVRPVGELVRAHTIEDAASGRRLYPTLVRGSLPAAKIRTVDAPETGYATDDVFEMEAFGLIRAFVSHTA